MRKQLQEISASASNKSKLNPLTWDAKRSADLLCGMGVTPMEDMENTPPDQDKLNLPFKRQKQMETGAAFFIARRLRTPRLSQPVVSWDSLPDELVLGIFSYLNITDLLKVAQVCKCWNRLSCDESLWYSVDITDYHLVNGVIGKLLTLGVVVLRGPRTYIGEPLFKQVRPLRLQHVDFSNCTISIDALQSIISRCHNLHNLSLEGLELSDMIMCAIAQNSYMKRLNLGGCSGISPESLTHMLKNCTSLQELNLSWCNFTEHHVKNAVENFPRSLKQLNFSGYRQKLKIADIDILVQRTPDLISLDLSDSVMLTGDCFPAFQNLRLQHLGLSRCYHIKISALLDLGNFPHLKTLSVFGILTTNSMKMLKKSFPHIKINDSILSTVARPTTGLKKNREIWGMKCKLSLLSS